MSGQLTSGVYRDLSEVPIELLALFDEPGQRSLFLSRAWLEVFLTEVRRAGDPVYWLASQRTSGKGSAALMPLWSPGGNVSGALSSLGNYYSPLVGPITSALVPDPELLVDLLRSINSATHDWQKITLGPLADEIAEGMQTAFKRLGWVTHRFVCSHNWHLPLHGAHYDDYLADRPSPLRNTIDRKTRALMKECRLSIYRDRIDVEEAVAAYLQVYAGSWKRPEPYPGFMPSLIRRAAAEGWLRLGVVWRNDEPIAAQVWFVKDGVASIFKLAYDENFGRLSPGTVLTAHLMRAVIDGDCVSEVDFLTGDEAFKADWMSHRRPRYGLIAYNTRSVRGILGAVRRKAVNATKELLVWATGSRDA